MALTIYGRAENQIASDIWQYAYAFQQFPISLISTTEDVTKLYVDVTLTSLADETQVIEQNVKWGDFDMYLNKYISLDLMAMAINLLKKQVYKFGDSGDFAINNMGVNSVIPEYRVEFSIYTDVDTAQEVKIIPILGHQMFDEWTAQVPETTDLTEFAEEGISMTTVGEKWSGGKIVTVSLVSPPENDVTPTITVSDTTGSCPPEYFLLWKSRLGGWVTWGFEISSITNEGGYLGKIEVNQFEWNRNTNNNPVGGHLYAPANYSGVESMKSVKLKSLSLSSAELRAVSGIKQSPAVYLMKPGSTRMELMRVSSVSAPIDSLANGGDFSVSLKSISNGKQFVM